MIGGNIKKIRMFTVTIDEDCDSDRINTIIEEIIEESDIEDDINLVVIIEFKDISTEFFQDVVYPTIAVKRDWIGTENNFVVYCTDPDWDPEEIVEYPKLDVTFFDE